MTKIFVTRKIPGTHLEKLTAAGFEIETSNFDRPLTEAELVDKVKGVDGLLTLLTDKVDGDLIDAAGPQLKIVSNYAVGFDNVEVKAATDRGVVVCNTPCDEVNEAVAEHTWALLLALARRVVEADESTRRGSYRGWEPDVFLGTSLVDKTLGVIGLGRIGSMVAKRARGYDMRVIYTKRSPEPPEVEREIGASFVSLDELLATSDFVSIHVPLTEETRHLINAENLAKVKRGAYLINTARGPIVDEHDLVEALRRGQLAGAGLDVFDAEPNIDPELIGMPNVILTPHIASATYEARAKMGEMAVDALINAFAGQMPTNIVNKEVWEKRRK